MLILYAVKSREGYLRCISETKVEVVGLDKASVYPEKKLIKAQELVSAAQKAGLSEVRLVTLELIERDPWPEKTADRGMGTG